MPLPALRAARRLDPARYLPLTLAGGAEIGRIARDFVPALRSHREAFGIAPEAVDVRSPRAMEASIDALARDGWIRGWRDERFEVIGAGFTLERAAFRRFGLRTSAIHLNGWTRVATGWRLWIARRSERKSVDPGQLDNVVAGGIGAGFTPEEALAKECIEEAGIPPQLAARAVRQRTFHVCREIEDGVQDELIHAFDLELPEGFQPENRDGEVASFRLVDAAEAANLLESDAFTVDAGVVTADFLWRHQAFDDPAIGAAIAALAAG